MYVSAGISGDALCITRSTERSKAALHFSLTNEAFMFLRRCCNDVRNEDSFNFVAEEDMPIVIKFISTSSSVAYENGDVIFI